jgi:hypothetical protein
MFVSEQETVASYCAVAASVSNMYCTVAALKASYCTVAASVSNMYCTVAALKATGL